MAGPNGILKSTSDSPPIHYTVKIELFSLFSERYYSELGYRSSQFEAGGYKWNLVLYPNGNKRRNVKDHISIYLVIAGTNSLPTGWEMLAQGKSASIVLYLMRPDSINLSRLKSLLMSRMDMLSMIHACMELRSSFVKKKKRTGKGECLRKIRNSSMYKHVWKIDNFSKLDAESCFSELFTAGGYKWKVHLYPKGIREGKDRHLSLFLRLANPETLPPGSSVFASFTLSILDQIRYRHHSVPGTNGGNGTIFIALGPSWGDDKFIEPEKLSQAGNGLLMNDGCIVEAEVTVRGTTGVL